MNRGRVRRDRGEQLSFSSEEGDEMNADDDFEDDNIDLEEKERIIKHYPKAFMNLNRNIQKTIISKYMA